MIKILEIKPQSGLLTELQSDTIYGHFCWRLKESLGNKKLVEFINYYKENNPIFLLSNGLLKSGEQIFFPRPFVFNKPIIQANKRDKIFDFVTRKNNKEHSKISLSELNSFLNNGSLEITLEMAGKKHLSFGDEVLRVNVQINRNSLAAEEGRLFSYNSKFVTKDFAYVVLFRILKEELFKEFNCEEIIKEVFSVGFGKKKSSGFGHFKDEMLFTAFKEIAEPQDGDAFIVLGNYLPSEDDNVFPIGYDINVKYGKLGEELAQSNNPFKNPIVFFTGGSCFKTKVNYKSFYGRITDNGEISEEHAYSVQFGCPFFLRMKI